MRGKIIRRGAALLIVMVLLASFALPALANEQVTATVALNLRSGPGTNYPIVGELKKGETVTRVGTSGNWSIILKGNSKLYASSSYLVTGSSSGSSGETVRYTSMKLNVRSGPGSSYKVISQLDKGSAVSVLGTVGSWSVIRWNDGTAYVFTSYLTGGSSAPSTGGTLMKATTNVNVRTGPGTSYKVIGVLVAGETITRTGTSGSWTKVSYKGTTAYVHSAYLTPASGSGSGSSSGNSFETTATVNVRSGPGASYNIIGSLSKGQRVTSISTVGSWTQIGFKSGTGYVISSYLKPVSSFDVSSANATMRAIASSTVRSGPGNNYTSLGTLSYGTIVQLTGYSGSWAQISFNGVTGFVQSNTLTDANNYNVSPASGDYMVDLRVSGREGPGSSYSEVFMFRGGEIVRRTGISGSWTRVIYNGMSMFVPTATLMRLDSFMSADKVMYTSGNNVLYYSEPVDSGWYRVNIVGHINTPVSVTGVGSSWVRVLIGSRTYYIMSRDLWDYDTNKYQSGGSISFSSGSINIYSDKLASIPGVSLGGTTVSAAAYGTHTLTFIEMASSTVAKVKITDSSTNATAYGYVLKTAI